MLMAAFVSLSRLVQIPAQVDLLNYGEDTLTYTDPAKQANSAMLWPDGVSSTNASVVIKWNIERRRSGGQSGWPNMELQP